MVERCIGVLDRRVGSRTYNREIIASRILQWMLESLCISSGSLENWVQLGTKVGIGSEVGNIGRELYPIEHTVAETNKYMKSNQFKQIKPVSIQL